MSDLALVRTVKRGFAQRLPKALITYLLQFVNFVNADLKHECLLELDRFSGFWWAREEEIEYTMAMYGGPRYIIEREHPSMKYCFENQLHNERDWNGDEYGYVFPR